MLQLIEVAEEFDGLMLLDALTHHLQEYSVTFLRRLVARGGVRLGGRRRAATDIVHTGDLLEAELEEGEAIRFEPRRRPLSILYEDRRVIAVDKPAGLPVLPERHRREPDFLNTLLYYLSNDSPHAQGGQSVRPLVVHRLDRDASGLIVLAKDRDALRALSEQFAARSVRKEYLALVRGRVRPTEGVIESPLLVDRNAATVRVDAERGKPSRTCYEVAEQFRNVALLRLRPTTGRLHQLRVHLKQAGYPVLCDPIYGDGAPLLLSSFKRDYRAKRDEPERPLLSRLALHARELAFLTPDGDRQVCVSAPLAKDIEVALKALRKYARA